jgi:signal transduction histidine kinase
MTSASAPHADVGALEWPAWLPAGTALLAVAAALVAAIQRGAVADPGLPVLFAALAAAPFVADAVVGRRLPRLAFGLVVLSAAALLLAGTPHAHDDAGPFLLVVLAVQVGATAPLRVSLPLLGLMLATVGALHALSANDESWLVWAFGIVAGYAGGHSVQTTLLLLAESRVREAETAERVAAEERERIAGEVHDVIAHSMTVTLLHLTGARRALEAEDVDEAVEALRDAEQAGRAAMADIRASVGLRKSAPQSPLEPAPGLADLDELVRSFTDAGLVVRSELEFPVGRAPAAVEAALYRVAQESLANVARHAPGAPVDLHVWGEPGSVRLRVRNPARVAVPARGDEAGSGHGIGGMRRRIELLGGSLAAGRAGDEWVVEAVVPQEAAV